MAKGSNKSASKAGSMGNTMGGNGNKAGQASGQQGQQGHQAGGGGTGGTTLGSALGGAMGLGTGQSAVEALKQDHRRVESLFSQFEKAGDSHRKEELVAMICTELNIHTRLEEEIFYPACREEIDDEDLMDEAQVEHDSAKFLIADLLQASSDDPYYDAKVKALKEQIRHHVAEEEKAGEGVFAKAQAHQVDTPQLAAELAERKQELQRRGSRLQPTRAVAFDIDLREMMGGGGGGGGRRGEDERDYRDRDRRGGWESERRMGSSGYRERDERGDDRGGRGRGGWSGDSEGHARAARRGWEEQEDDRGRGGSRSEWRGQGQGGVHERGRDDERRGSGGHGGWYGDPEGHARAARRRWEEEDDDRRGRGDWDRRR
jgi:hypothetical protein